MRPPEKLKFKQPVSKFLSAALGVLAACGGDPRADAIDDYILGIDPFASSEPELRAGEESAPERDGDFSCTTTNYKETRQYDRVVAYAANSDSLWPGAIIRGDSVEDGLFTQVVLPRSPLAVSVSMENLEGGNAAVMDEPRLSGFRDAISEILSTEVTGATPANIYAEIEEVHSESQLNIALGASAKWIGSAASIAASYDFEKKDTRSRYLVKYTQAYYTVDVDPPANPAGWFDPLLTVDDIEGHFGPGNPPMYVSSITYGRTVVFTFESSYSSQELGAALEFAYRGGVEVSGEVSASSREVLENSRVTAYVLGGSGAVAAKSIDSYEGLMEFIHSGGNYSRDSPGAPIAYKLNYLANNEPARLSFTDSYEVRECFRIAQRIKVTLDWFQVLNTGGDGPDLELFGTVYAEGESGATLFERGSEHAVVVNRGETWPRQGYINEDVIRVSPRPGETLALRAELWDHDGGWFSDDDSVGIEGVDIPFEAGWRKQVILRLSGNGAQVDVGISLKPL